MLCPETTDSSPQAFSWSAWKWISVGQMNRPLALNNATTWREHRNCHLLVGIRDANCNPRAGLKAWRAAVVPAVGITSGSSTAVCFLKGSPKFCKWKNHCFRWTLMDWNMTSGDQTVTDWCHWRTPICWGETSQKCSWRSSAKTQLGSKDQNNVLGCAKYSIHNYCLLEWTYVDQY